MELVITTFVQFYQAVIEFLPGSPFTFYISKIEDIPYLAELNWFVPITEIIVITETWLSAVAVFYTYSAIMRFIRLIQ